MMKFLKRSIGMALLLVILLTGCTGDKSEASITKEDEKNKYPYNFHQWQYLQLFVINQKNPYTFSPFL